MPLSEAAVIGLTLGGSALGALGSGLSNSAAKKIARETNAQNYKMFQEQQQYNWDMWRATNEYNSPVEARKRLIEAGYNPAALLDAQQLGAAQTISGASPNAAVGYEYQSPVRGFGEALARFPSDMLSLAQSRKTNEEAKGLAIENQFKESTIAAQLRQMVASGILDEKTAEKMRLDNKFRLDNWDRLVEQLDAETEKASSDARLARLEATLMETYGNRIKDAELAEIAQRIDTLVRQGKEADAHSLLMKIQGDNDKARLVIEKQESAARQGYILSQTQQQILQNAITREFGKSIAAAELATKVAEGKIKDADAFMSEIEKAWYDENKSPNGARLQKGLRRLGRAMEDVLPIKHLFK